MFVITYIQPWMKLAPYELDKCIRCRWYCIQILIIFQKHLLLGLVNCRAVNGPLVYTWKKPLSKWNWWNPIFVSGSLTQFWKCISNLWKEIPRFSCLCTIQINLWKINQIFKVPAWMVCYIEETLMYSTPFTLSVLI